MDKADFANLENVEFIEELYEKWRQDPDSVDASWQQFFAGFELGKTKYTDAPTGGAASGSDQGLWQMERLIYAYRSHGHLLANINPLEAPPAAHPDLSLERFGFTEADLDKEYPIADLLGKKSLKLKDAIALLQQIYCGRATMEYTYIRDRAQRQWLQNRFEALEGVLTLSLEQKTRLLRQLYRAEMFETFVHKKFLGQKRFSLEGAEALIPALDTVRESAPDLGIKELVIGMPHRGRLNVLANIVDKSFVEIFSEFEDNYLPDMVDGSGDVKYHRGYTSDYTTTSGDKLHISLSSNPSHLEAVNPVTMGRARAKQRQHGVDRKSVLPILIHGDASFSGQGLVMETLQMMRLEGYSTGGALHIIVNNQIGFTTDPQDGRSTLYPTDIAKMMSAPVFHVNGDSPESLLFCIGLALQFRQQFGVDTFINLMCYRKHGHNETDEPSYTQPIMYEKIGKHPNVSRVYEDQLVNEGVLVESGDAGAGQVSKKAMRKEFQDLLNEALDTVRKKEPHKPEVQQFTGYWQRYHRNYNHDVVDTAVSEKGLERVVDALFSWPDGFTLNKKIARQLDQKHKLYLGKADGKKGRIVDWAMAEALAMGSLLAEGTPVRLSGQDSRRGTFSQRHSVLYDAHDGTTYIPLNDICEGQATLCVYNSFLSEAAVLGFDYGYSLVEPEMLIMWEAQFGDFVNGAQVIIDQFITSAEPKWQRASGIVLLLPHGYEGMGPEHSSARLERFLQSCAEDNIQVGNFSTPAQYFHGLRRQMKRNFRKPLVLMTPKSLLRHSLCVSSVDDLTSGHFHEVLDDAEVKPKKVNRLIFCSGKLYYDLLEYRREKNIQDSALIRVEQFYPWPLEQLKQTIKRYPNVRDITWAQEEPENMGSWFFLKDRLQDLVDQKVVYTGRPSAASPATGSLAIHRSEQRKIVEASFQPQSEVTKQRELYK